MTYHTIRLRYYIILTLLSFYSNLLYGYVVEPSYSWDGSKLVTDEIEFVLPPGKWGEPIQDPNPFPTADLIDKIITMMKPISEFETEKVNIININFGAAGKADDFIQSGVEFYLSIATGAAWHNYFTTKHGYSAGVISYQVSNLLSNSHMTYLYVQGQITKSDNSLERIGVILQLLGSAGQIDLNDIKSFTDGLKFNNSVTGDGGSDNSINDGTGGGEDSGNTESGAKTWLWYKHYPWVYDHPSKEWIYLRGSVNGEIYAYRSSTKKWDEFSATFLLENNEGKGDAEKTWEDKYEEWILDPEPYGGLNILQQIKEAKDSEAMELNFHNRNISDLTPLEGLKNLMVLHLGLNNITDLTSLEGLTNLESLWLWGNSITDLTPLAGLTNLKKLVLSLNNITDLTPLAGLKNLTVLELTESNISDLTPLAGLKNLTVLELTESNISDLTPLAGLTNLESLWLYENNISDLTPLAGLTNLQGLSLQNNNISDLTPLAGLTNLMYLFLHRNNISDLTSLAGLTNLISLNLEGNNISTSQKAILEEALPNTNITWPDVILDDSEEDSMVSTKTISLSLTVDLDLILVEPGTFTMGSPNSESQEFVVLDQSQSQVIIDDQFYLGKYEVTNEQWLAVMDGNTERISVKPSFHSNFTQPDHPVERVSWNDIQVFFTRLNTQQSNNIPEGWEYKLPSEFQWEYACRAGTTTAYFWGDSIDTDDANYDKSYLPYTRPRQVGEYNPNPWGFYDMHGNLFEWTSDIADRFSKANGYAFDSRIIRGGSFKDPKEQLRSAYRSFQDPDSRDEWLGFRVSLQKIEN